MVHRQHLHVRRTNENAYPLGDSEVVRDKQIKQPYFIIFELELHHLEPDRTNCSIKLQSLLQTSSINSEDLQAEGERFRV